MSEIGSLVFETLPKHPQYNADKYASFRTRYQKVRTQDLLARVFAFILQSLLQVVSHVHLSPCNPAHLCYSALQVLDQRLAELERLKKAINARALLASEAGQASNNTEGLASLPPVRTGVAALSRHQDAASMAEGILRAAEATAKLAVFSCDDCDPL